MDTPGRGLSAEALRAAVDRALEHTSLQQLARDIGVSAAGLLKLMGGAAPRRTTLRKLQDWHVRQGTSLGESSEDAMRYLLAWSLEGLVDEDRARLTRDFLDAVEAAHRARGTHPPKWLGAIRENPLAPPGGGAPEEGDAAE